VAIETGSGERDPSREGFRGNGEGESGHAGHGASLTESDRFERARARYLQRGELTRDERIGAALGWLSVGLGLTALVAPRAVCRVTGMPEQPLLMRTVGVRELISGAGLLTQGNRGAWLWSRVAGDAMDLALLGSAAFDSGNRRRLRAKTALAVVAAIGVADLAAGLRQSRRATHSRRLGGGAQEALVEQTLIVNKSPAECYAFWRDLNNLPRFMTALEAVSVQDERTSHWVMRTAAGTKLQWDSEITADRAGERIGWRSQPGADLQHAGSVQFAAAPGGRGCMVRLMIHYQPPIGGASVGLARLLGHDPNAEARENLRRFKQLLETGEISTTTGQPSGRRSWLGGLTPEGRKSRPGRILKRAAL
jgi:uncharacterized membrane protein